MDTIDKFMGNFILKISLLMFSMLHIGITTMMQIKGTPIAQSSMTTFIVCAAISISTLFVLSIVPLMKSVHEPTSNKQ